MALYTPPSVTTDTNFDYEVTLTATSAQSAVAIATNFRVVVKPRPPGGQVVTGAEPSVLLNPVILSLTANVSDTPGTVELAAAVSDDGGPAQLGYQWSYTPEPRSPAATFASGGRGNPGLFTGYTVAHRGTMTLAVTDGDGGTTTLHDQLGPYQFADAIDRTSVNRLRQISWMSPDPRPASLPPRVGRRSEWERTSSACRSGRYGCAPVGSGDRIEGESATARRRARCGGIEAAWRTADEREARAQKAFRAREGRSRGSSRPDE